LSRRSYPADGAGLLSAVAHGGAGGVTTDFKLSKLDRQFGSSPLRSNSYAKPSVPPRAWVPDIEVPERRMNERISDGQFISAAAER